MHVETRGQAALLSIPYMELQIYVQKPVPSLNLLNYNVDIPAFNVVITCMTE